MPSRGRPRAVARPAVIRKDRATSTRGIGCAVTRFAVALAIEASPVRATNGRRNRRVIGITGLDAAPNSSTLYGGAAPRRAVRGLVSVSSNARRAVKGVVS